MNSRKSSIGLNTEIPSPVKKSRKSNEPIDYTTKRDGRVSLSRCDEIIKTNVNASISIEKTSLENLTADDNLPMLHFKTPNESISNINTLQPQSEGTHDLITDKNASSTQQQPGGSNDSIESIANNFESILESLKNAETENVTIEVNPNDFMEVDQIENVEAAGKKPRKKHNPLDREGHTWHVNKIAGNTVYYDCCK